MKYCRGQSVICTWKDHSTQYEAKIIEVSAKRKKTPYKVHYPGWKHKWDEWIGEDRIMKVNSKRKLSEKGIVAMPIANAADIEEPSTSQEASGIPDAAVEEDSVKKNSLLDFIEPSMSDAVPSSSGQKETPPVKIVDNLAASKGRVSQIKRPSRPRSNSSAVSTDDGSVSSSKSNSRKRKIQMTGWIRRSSRTQKMQMQQLGLSEELASVLLEETDSSINSINSKKSKSSLMENCSISNSSLSVAGAKLSCGNTDSAKDTGIKSSNSSTSVMGNTGDAEKNGTRNSSMAGIGTGTDVKKKSKNLKIRIPAAGVSPTASVNGLDVKFTQEPSTSQQAAAAHQNGGNFSVKQEQQGPESTFSDVSKGTERIGGNDSSDSHGADMISPTTAIVNIAYELAQAFPGCSEKLSARFLSLSPAAAKLNLINDLKSCERSAYADRTPTPGIARNIFKSEAADCSAENKSEASSVSPRRSLSRDVAASSSDAAPNMLRTKSVDQSTQVDRMGSQRDLPVLSVDFQQQGRNIEGRQHDISDVELTDGPELIDLQSYSPKGSISVPNLLSRNGQSKVLSISEFARRIYGAREKMAHQRQTDQLPASSSQRMRMADIFRGNRPAENGLEVRPSSSGLPSNSTAEQQHAEALPAVTSAPAILRRPLSAQSLHMSKANSNGLVRVKQMHASTSYNGRTLFVNQNVFAEPVPRNRLIMPMPDDLLEEPLLQSEVAETDEESAPKLQKIEEFAPLPPVVLEDHCYIKLPGGNPEVDMDGQNAEDENSENDEASDDSSRRRVKNNDSALPASRESQLLHNGTSQPYDGEAQMPTLQLRYHKADKD